MATGVHWSPQELDATVGHSIDAGEFLFLGHSGVGVPGDESW